MRDRILLVDDDEDALESIARFLEGIGYEVASVEDAEAGLNRLGAFDPAIVITDFQMPGMSGLELLDLLRVNRPDLNVILITGTEDMQTAVEAMKRGAYDYLPKPLDLDAFEELIGRCIRDRAVLSASASGPGIGDGETLPRLVGRSPSMVSLYKLIGTLSGNRAPVLIRGESGTGKELFARAIHTNSDWSHEPFVGVNCTALAEGVLESELFGHAKGAFTGATTDRKGRFELAGRGTVFLDEIGDTTAAFQAKLLRVLQEGEYFPVGSEQARTTEARVVAATHRDLEEAVRAGEFRGDLYFRLRVVEVRIPPLREREDDIPRLAGHFLKRASAKVGKRVFEVTEEALQALRSHRWPGNVRELENAITRAVVFATGPAIRVEHLGLGEGLIESGDASPPNLTLGAAEAAHVQTILRQTGGIKREAARRLNISRSRLDRIVKQHDLETDFD